MKIFSILLIITFVNLPLLSVVKAEESTSRIYCSNHSERQRFHGNGLPFELRGFKYVLTAHHVVTRNNNEQTYNYTWFGNSDASNNQMKYHWGNKDLDIAILEQSDQTAPWPENINAEKGIPSADTALLQQLAEIGTTGEIRCVIEGSDLNPIPIFILSHSTSQIGEVRIRVADTSIHRLSRGMSGGLVYVDDNLFGVLTAADTINGTAIVTRWDLVRREALEYLNSIPIQICLREWEHKAKFNRKMKIGTGVGILAASVVALISNKKANDFYDEYKAAVDPITIQSKWDDYEDKKRLRNISGIVAGGLAALEIVWVLSSPKRPTYDGDCVQKISHTSTLGFKTTAHGISLAYSW